MTTRFHAGDLAPDFSASDLAGQPLRLSDQRGGAVLLSFYRYASCPICNLCIRERALEYPGLRELGLTAIAVFQSPADRLREYMVPDDLPFPVIADPTMRLYRAYGLERSLRGMLGARTVAAAVRALRQGHLPGLANGPLDRMPADFLIDSAGRIGRAWYGRTADDHLPQAQIRSWLEGHRPPAG
jgi:peroxiredoxin Q/BCP